MKNHMPNDIFVQIQDHLRKKAVDAEDGWEAGEDEEDTLTGHLGAMLQRRWTVRRVIKGRTWAWRVRYRKFRSKGKNALESTSGADGIIQVELEDSSMEEKFYKGLLFQAKKEGRVDGLATQTRKMEELQPAGSAIIVFGPDGYRGLKSQNYKENGKTELDQAPPLSEFLSDHFLICNVGIVGMYFDPDKKILIVPSEPGPRFLHYQIEHRITIQVRVSDT